MNSLRKLSDIDSREKNCKYNVSVSMVCMICLYVFSYKTVIKKVVTIWPSNLGNTIQYITPYQPIMIQKQPKMKIVTPLNI